MIDNAAMILTFKSFDVRNLIAISIVWFDFSNCSSIWTWHKVKISSNISNFFNIVFQNYKRNFEFLFDTMIFEIFQSVVKSLFKTSIAQFFAKYVDLFEIIVNLLKNLHVMINNVFNLFDIVMIKFMITIWNEINEKTININFLYILCLTI